MVGGIRTAVQVVGYAVAVGVAMNDDRLKVPGHGIDDPPGETDWQRLFASEDVAIAILISPDRLDPAKGTARLQVRLLDVATGEVTWAGSFAVERLPPDRPARRTAESPLDELARRIVDAMSGPLQPIVVHGDADGAGIPD